MSDIVVFVVILSNRRVTMYAQTPPIAKIPRIMEIAIIVWDVNILFFIFPFAFPKNGYFFDFVEFLLNTPFLGLPKM